MSQLPDPGIENCRLRFECRQRWDELEVIARYPDVRYCVQCRQAVHRVRSEDEFRAHAAAGRCVALALPEGGMQIGEARAPYGVKSGGND